MANSIQRDQRRRLLFSRLEIKRAQYKALLQDALISSSVKKDYAIKLHKTPRNSSIGRIRRRCTLTGRSRAVLRFCKISRIALRELASQGLLNGVQKASW